MALAVGDTNLPTEFVSPTSEEVGHPPDRAAAVCNPGSIVRGPRGDASATRGFGSLSFCALLAWFVAVDRLSVAVTADRSAPLILDPPAARLSASNCCSVSNLTPRALGRLSPNGVSVRARFWDMNAMGMLSVVEAIANIVSKVR